MRQINNIALMLAIMGSVNVGAPSPTNSSASAAAAASAYSIVTSGPTASSSSSSPLQAQQGAHPAALLANGSTTMIPAPSGPFVEGIVLVGTVLAFAGEVKLGVGYLECDGQEYLVTEYYDLFSAIGFAYGSRTDKATGARYFNVPDYRGSFLRGVDEGSNNDPDSNTRNARGDGKTGDIVGTKQEDATNFSRIRISREGDHKHKIPAFTRNQIQMSSILQIGEAEKGFLSEDLVTNSSIFCNMVTGPEGGHTHKISGGDRETRPRNISVRFIIKAKPDYLANTQAIVDLQSRVLGQSNQSTATVQGQIQPTNAQYDNILQQLMSRNNALELKNNALESEVAQLKDKQAQFDRQQAQFDRQQAQSDKLIQNLIADMMLLKKAVTSNQPFAQSGPTFTPVVPTQKTNTLC